MPTPSLLHPRNPHQGRYDLSDLCRVTPQLKEFIISSPGGEATLDFANEKAVLCLNQALLARYYQVAYWQLPPGYLCPPIPGRADYVHYLADLLSRSTGTLPKGKQYRLLDIGTGASCIYPIIASQSYGWRVLASDIDDTAIKAASVVLAANPALKRNIELIRQPQAAAIFQGVLSADTKVHLTMCNPPFYASAAQAAEASERKWTNLGKAEKGATRNFSGQQHELWCDGGELQFIRNMITESQLLKQQVCWFSCLVSQQKHIAPLQKLLREVCAAQQLVIDMRQGNKVSRILAWSFLNETQQQQWCKDT